MHGHRHHRSFAALAAAAVALVAGATAAQGSGALPQVPNAACPASPSARQVPGPGAARSAAIHMWDDYIEDVVTAPDICASNLLTNDNVRFTMVVHIHDRSSFAALDSYSVLLDTDSNPATGGSPDPGTQVGAEYVIDLVDDASRLSSWDGTAFTPVAPQPEILTTWIPEFGPAFQIDRAALGDPQSFDLILRTANGADRDLAPDSGAWSYTTSPLRLTARKLAVGPARAGKPLAVGLHVTRSDFEVALDEGRITCAATLTGKALTGRGRFVDEVVQCTWRLPKGTAGKRVSGSVAVTFQGVTARRSFSVRVK